MEKCFHARVLATTIDIDKLVDIKEDANLDNLIKDNFVEFSGKNAGICYMKDKYDSSRIKDGAVKRFTNTIKSTHHSVAGHCYATVLFEDVPKIFAMILNSLQCYNTSEKSARYTKMSNLSEKENTLYNKWIYILENKISELLNIDKKDANKLAMENARYFISIFTPSTTFSYTTSIRQWNYISIWFENLCNLNIDNEFNKKLIPVLKEFVSWFKSSLLYNELFTDPKDRRINFIPEMYNDTYNGYTVISDVYQIKYTASYSALAQLQRHRTIEYIISDLDNENFNFFIPDFIVDDEELCNEWCNDMCTMEGLFPQGQCVTVTERGTMDKFLLKCDERLCGRTQYETNNIVKNVLLDFYNNKGYISPYYVDKLNEWVDPDTNRVKAKCEIRKSGCSDKSGCIRGPKYANDRLL